MKKIKITKEQFNRVTILLKEEFPKLKKNIVDKTFKNEFANKNIKNLGEDTDFKIQKDINVKGVNKKAMGKFMKESTGDLKQETLDFINYLYNKNEDLPSYDEICKELESKGIVINVDGKFKLSKSLGSAEEAKQAVENELSKLIGGGEKEEIEEGDWFDSHPDHPANQSDPVYSKASINPNNLAFDLVMNLEGEDLAILKDKTGIIYVLNLADLSDEDKNTISDELGFTEEEVVGRDEDGQPEIDKYYGWENNEDEEKQIIAAYADSLADEAGNGLKDFDNNYNLVILDEPLKNQLLDFYSNNTELSSILSGLNESEESEEEKRRARIKASLAKSRTDSQKWDAERFAARDKQNAIDSKKAEDKLKLRKDPEPTPEPKKPVGQYRLFDKGIDEMNAGDAGAFTPALGAHPMRKEMPIVTKVPVVKENFELGKDYTHFAIFKADGKIATGWDYSSLYDKYEKAYDDESIKEYSREDIMNDFPDNKVSDFKLVTRKYLDNKGVNPSDTNNWYKLNVNETLTVQGGGNFKYDTPGGLTMDLGKNNPKPNAFKRTQWHEGGFVEFNDCVKLNNKPAGTGCSAGAVDNVVKIKKTKGNVNAPSLGENKIYETIAKKTGKTIDEVKIIIESKKNK